MVIIGFLLYALVAAAFSAVDGLIGKLFLSDVLPNWGYWDFFGAAVFGSAIVGTALLFKSND